MILRAETKLDSRPEGPAKPSTFWVGPGCDSREEEEQRVLKVRWPWLCPHDCHPTLGPVLDSAATIKLRRVTSRPHV